MTDRNKYVVIKYYSFVESSAPLHFYFNFRYEKNIHKDLKKQKQILYIFHTLPPNHQFSSIKHFGEHISSVIYERLHVEWRITKYEKVCTTIIFSSTHLWQIAVIVETKK